MFVFHAVWFQDPEGGVGETHDLGLFKRWKSARDAVEESMTLFDGMHQGPGGPDCAPEPIISVDDAGMVKAATWLDGGEMWAVERREVTE